MHIIRYILLFALAACCTHAYADYPERSDMARQRGQKLTVKEWKTTPDGKNRWVDHIEVYNAEGQLIEESEYSDFGRSLAWRSEYTYNSQGQLTQEVVYNERNRVTKVRKFEYDSEGVCTRRLNYNANGILNSYRAFEYTFE
ncbi:MAG: hypothetical protein J6V59_02205 [Alistipes sp.]|nr:hypothetical protein [Alistipes sp.]